MTFDKDLVLTSLHFFRFTTISCKDYRNISLSNRSPSTLRQAASLSGRYATMKSKIKKSPADGYLQVVYRSRLPKSAHVFANSRIGFQSGRTRRRSMRRQHAAAETT